jgi:hypothetical protein
MNMNSRRIQTKSSLASFTAVLAAAGILLCGAKAQAQPVVSGIYPDGLHQFEYSNSISFTATSASGITAIQVTVAGNTLLGAGSLNIYSLGDGLTTVGSANSEIVSAPLTSNEFYSVTISVTDAKGTTSSKAGFDTLIPAYTWEAEDWDYTNSAGDPGQFFDNPQTNKYAGLGALSGTDFLMENPNNGSESYRPQTISGGASVGLETQTTADLPRLPWFGSSPYKGEDYEVGYTDSGDFANYTRHYPKGVYNVFARLSDGNGNATSAAQLSVLAGTAQFSGQSPFGFSDKNTGWTTYAFYPLLDSSGALVQLTTDGSQSTIQLSMANGNFNANYFLLMLADTNPVVASSALFTNQYPDGATQFQPSTNLAFTVADPNGIEPGGIIVILAGSNLLGQAVSITYTVADGLTTSGPDTNLQASLPLQSNTTYNVTIYATDLTGALAVKSWGFDTISPSYTWEAEDFDYSMGQYVDNPQTNAYYGTDGIFGYDCYSDAGSINHGTPYRQSNEGGPETEGCGDTPRAAYTNSFPNNLNPITGLPYQDYDCGFNDNNDWENYTRHYPNGTWNIYVRGANGGGGAGSGGMELVTSGVGTSSQTVTNLGTFTYPSTGNWQSYVFSALKDTSGNLVAVTLSGGGPETLRTIAPSSGNMNFFMLVPADTTLPQIHGLYPDGVGFFEQTNAFSFTASSSLGIATSNIIVMVNGTDVAANLSFTGSANSWFVSYPLQNNNTYSITVSVTANGGDNITTSVAFDTFSPNNYTWESGDFDYTGTNGVPGQFFDNPQIDAYNGLGATPGIDELEVTAGANLANDLYRADNNGPTPALAGDLLIDTQPGGDLPRAQFGTNATWLLQWFGYGDFANYTRHYPAGSYNVYARFKNGGSATTQETLWEVTGAWGTTNQQTEFIGAWSLPSEGWGAWYWATLMTTNTIPEPAVVTFNGSTNTLQLGSSLAQDGQNCNVGFFMLVPATPTGLTLTASLSAGNISISFPTTTGKNYQVVYKNNLNASSWTTVGAPLVGNNAVQSVQYSTTGAQGYYSVQIQ